MSYNRTRIPSPARSQGAPRTPRRYVTPRKARSVCSPGRSNGPVRLSTLIQEHREQEKNSFVLSPIARKSLLPDDTNVEMPGRQSWWKNLNDQSRDVMEVLKENAIEPHNIMEELNIEVLSQEEKKRYTLDLPDSSDCESIHSIVIPHKRLFNEKENRPQRQFDDFGNRGTLEKVYRESTETDKTTSTVTKELFHNKPISRPAFPAALLDVSANTTVGDKTLAPAIKPRTGLRNMFGAQQATKRKNMFAKFIESTDYSSEEEIADVSDKQKRFFDLPKPGIQTQPPVRRSSSRLRDPSPTSNVTTDSFADWDQLPSSTMVENQLEAILTGGNKAKRSKISKLADTSSPSTSNIIKSGNKSKQSDKSTSSKNKSQIKNKSLQTLDVQDTSQTLNQKETSKINESKIQKPHQSTTDKGIKDLVESSFKNNKNKSIQKEKEITIENIQMDIEDQSVSLKEQIESQKLVDQNTNKRNQTLHISQTKFLNKSTDKVTKKSAETSTQNEDEESILREDIEMEEWLPQNKSVNKNSETCHNKNVTNILDKCQDIQSEKENNEAINNSQVYVNKDEELKDNYLEDDNNVENHLVRTGEIIKENKQNNSKAPALNTETQNETDVYQDINNTLDSNKKIEKSQGIEAEQNEIGNNEKPNEIENDDQENDDKEEEHVEEDEEIAYHEELNERVVEEKQQESSEENNESQEIEIEKTENNEEKSVEQNITLEEQIESDVENQEIVHESDIENHEEKENECEVEQEIDEIEVESERDPGIEDNEDEIDNQDVEDAYENQEMEQEASNGSIQDSAESEAENDHDSEHEYVNESQHDSENEEANESEPESETEEVNETQHEVNKSQHVSDNEEEIENADESDYVQVNESEHESENEEVDASNQEVDTDQNDDNDHIDNTANPDISHDTTGRNRKKPDNVSIEAGVFRPTKELEHSFTGRGRNTSVRKSKSLINPNIEPEKMQENNTRGSISMTESRNSSAEGSGWDSHRTTRKTLRQTFGKDFTPRKSLRALVMEKSAKRHTLAKGSKDVTSGNIPLANSTELAEASIPQDDYEMHEETAEPVQEISIRTRKATLEEYLIKISKENEEKRVKMAQAVKKHLEQRPKEHNPFKVPARPAFPRKTSQIKTKTSANIRLKLTVPLEELPQEIQEDLKYKPPKRFAPRNAAWLTKRFYKYVESKLEPKYDYKARLRAEKFAQTLHGFVQNLRRRDVALPDSVAELKHEMARLKIVKTHFDFYNFFWDYMPREVRVKVIPDLTNKIPQPRAGIYSDILEGDVRG